MFCQWPWKSCSELVVLGGHMIERTVVLLVIQLCGLCDYTTNLCSTSDVQLIQPCHVQGLCIGGWVEGNSPDVACLDGAA
ncbi:unnamed protein product [Pleuronectes platessa]|uniref:Uncharacterized protein n=1 Tax=Pleuronectes platessa TaxID=8262 RepID=A0A9N7Y9P3_PLEPL|nr:unnamed protein product [Pleuronectes platessa]